MGGIFLHQGAWWRKIPPISCTSKASPFTEPSVKGADRDDKCWPRPLLSVTRREIFDENLASGDGIANGLGQLEHAGHPRMAAAPASAAGRPATTWLAFRQRMPGVSSLRHSGMSLRRRAADGRISSTRVPGGGRSRPSAARRRPAPFTEPSVKGADRDDIKAEAEAIAVLSPDARFSTKISRRVTA